MIELNSDNLLASGGGRDVYQHPHDQDLLLKVNRNKPARPSLKAHFQIEKRRFGPYREWFVEHRHYIACLNQRGSGPSYLPEFRGFTDTSQGIAQIVEKIRDADSGNLSKTLTQSLQSPDVNISELTALIEQLFRDFGRDRVVFRDLNPTNLCVVRNREGRPSHIVVVDGLGDFTLIKVRSYFVSAYRKWHRGALAEVLRYVEGFSDVD